jgi:toxin ParE1/3/4
MSYRLTNKAVEDIITIFDEGVRLFGREQAEKYHAELESVFRLVECNPELARLRHEISPPVRVHPHGSHLIIYSVENSSDVLIIRIRHSHEDWESPSIDD